MLYHRGEGVRLTLRTVRDCGNRGPEAKDGNAFGRAAGRAAGRKRRKGMRALYNAQGEEATRSTGIDPISQFLHAKAPKPIILAHFKSGLVRYMFPGK